VGGGVVRSLVMRSPLVRGFGVCGGLMMDSLGMGSGLVMLRFRMSSSLVMRGFGVGGGLVMHSFGMGSGLVIDRFGVCRTPGMGDFWVRSGGRLNRVARLAVIDREVLIAVISSLLLKRTLRCGCLEMMIVDSRFLGGSGSGVDSTRPVEADAIICRSIIDYCTIHVGVVDDGRIHTPNSGVIPEGISLPPTSVETGTIITEAIVDTPVESNVRAPITVVPMIEAVAKSPVSRGPKVSRLGHLYPGARNPEIAIVPIGPVAWTPKISVLRTRRLLVGDEGRRGNCNRNSLSEKRSRWAEQTREENRSGGFHQVQHR